VHAEIGVVLSKQDVANNPDLLRDVHKSSLPIETVLHQLEVMIDSNGKANVGRIRQQVTAIARLVMIHKGTNE
jgi:hypothetical protein